MQMTVTSTDLEAQDDTYTLDQEKENTALISTVSD